MKLHGDLAAAIDAGVHGHLVTLNPDGSPQVTMIWVGREGDDLQVAHLGAGQKLRNIERDPRVALSIVVPGSNPIGLDNYAVIHGTATITAGGAPDLLQRLAPRFLGEGVKFPPMDDPPPGRVIHIAIHRVTGSGPWVT
jgi:PPOX class probable F420-dependent enzyme